MEYYDTEMMKVNFCAGLDSTNA